MNTMKGLINIKINEDEFANRYKGIKVFDLLRYVDMQLKRASPNGASNHRMQSLRQSIGFSLSVYREGYRSLEETVDECRERDNNYFNKIFEIILESIGRYGVKI